MAARHGLIDLIRPLLGGRVEHATRVRYLSAHVVLAKEGDHSRCTKLPCLAPVGETEPVDHRIKAVI